MDNKTHYVDRYIQRDPEWKRKKLLIEYFPTKRLSMYYQLLHCYFKLRDYVKSYTSRFFLPIKMTSNGIIKPMDNALQMVFQESQKRSCYNFYAHDSRLVRHLILLQTHKCSLLIMGLHIFEIKLCQGAFTNYVNRFLAFFDHVPTLVCNSKHLGYHPYVIT